MKKNLIKLAAFLAVTAIVLTAASRVLDGGYWFSKQYIFDRSARYAEITLEERGQIDVLNLGDSLSTSALTPVELYRDYGITAFNLGADMQYLDQTFYALKLALRTQDIKVVLLETNNFFYNDEDDPARDYGRGCTEFWQSLFPVIRFHNVWQRFNKGPGIRVYYKGFLVNEGLEAYEGERYYNTSVDKRWRIAPYEMRYFKKILRLCEAKGIKLVLYSAPSPINYYYAKHNSLSDLAQEYGLDYLDANYDIDEVGIDWSQDTHDGGEHLNLFGTRKMTTYLGAYLSTQCGLPDHRSEEAYRAWLDLQEPYALTVEEMQGTYYSEIEDFFGLD